MCAHCDFLSTKDWIKEAKNYNTAPSVAWQLGAHAGSCYAPARICGRRSPAAPLLPHTHPSRQQARFIESLAYLLRTDLTRADKLFLSIAICFDYEKITTTSMSEYQVLTATVKMRKGGMFMFCDQARIFYESLKILMPAGLRVD